MYLCVPKASAYTYRIVTQLLCSRNHNHKTEINLLFCRPFLLHWNRTNEYSCSCRWEYACNGSYTQLKNKFFMHGWRVETKKSVSSYTQRFNKKLTKTRKLGIIYSLFYITKMFFMLYCSKYNCSWCCIFSIPEQFFANSLRKAHIKLL